MPLKIILHAPYRLLARQDAKAARALLLKVGIPVKSHLGSELQNVLTSQIMAWRDFFTLRGVKMNRETLFIMKARSIAADAGVVEVQSSVDGTVKANSVRNNVSHLVSRKSTTVRSAAGISTAFS